MDKRTSAQDANLGARIVVAGLSGLLFAVGLVVSGMTQTAKVIGFLNLGGLKQGLSWSAQPGYWDPSLAFVMGGALSVTATAFRVTANRTPYLGGAMALPTSQAVDWRLLSGSALFGIGWGLAGYCPGPAVASLLTAGLPAAVFCAAMLAAMALVRLILRASEAKPQK
jgi:uncharacterized protein